MNTISNSEKDTETLGRQLARQLKAGDVMALYGSLGSGKTAFTRGICGGLNCTSDVHSPTFNIVNFYPGDIEVAHVDLYRVDSSLDDIGWDDLFDTERILIIEWAEKAKKSLPGRRIDIFFSIIDMETRRIEVKKTS
ncbi:MAG: tRNA (adenosine(37)-N6)-threonylcarbamoyltransferase complex ATPase subunit type 1 TsaE [candidate division Zixibacteria bacterium]|nr:tRNA (adenosine(37)-N6)-threonylcarbamoyltransferase complex ATPase subunit type 1 TsaE [candidate division Zixibacteria bacterium]